MLESLAAVQTRIQTLQRLFPQPASFQLVFEDAFRDPPPDTPGAVRVREDADVTDVWPGATTRPANLAALQGPAPAWTDALPAHGRPWAAAIDRTASRHGLDGRLLAALVWTESGFRPDAVSHAGATGLAQLMPQTAAALGVDPRNPLQNLEGGARYLREQLDRFGSVDLALAAYNAGPARVQESGGIPDIAETQAYVPRVLDHLRALEAAS